MIDQVVNVGANLLEDSFNFPFGVDMHHSIGFLVVVDYWSSLGFVKFESFLDQFWTVILSACLLTSLGKSLLKSGHGAVKVENSLQMVFVTQLFVPGLNVLLIFGKAFNKVNLRLVSGHLFVKSCNHQFRADQSASVQIFFDFVSGLGATAG